MHQRMIIDQREHLKAREEEWQCRQQRLRQEKEEHQREMVQYRHQILQQQREMEQPRRGDQSALDPRRADQRQLDHRERGDKVITLESFLCTIEVWQWATHVLIWTSEFENEMNALHLVVS